MVGDELQGGSADRERRSRWPGRRRAAGDVASDLTLSGVLEGGFALAKRGLAALVAAVTDH